MHVTFQQNKGKYNPNYWTALYHFDEDDKHFFNRKDKSKCNWMPKHDEIALMLKTLLEVEDADKRQKLKDLFIAAIDTGFETEQKYNQ